MTRVGDLRGLALGLAVAVCVAAGADAYYVYPNTCNQACAPVYTPPYLTGYNDCYNTCQYCLWGRYSCYSAFQPYFPSGNTWTNDYACWCYWPWWAWLLLSIGILLGFLVLFFGIRAILLSRH